MKKKVKLFASIASLCLAVALMAFGVYAATSVTYNVTSTVTFASQAKVQFIGEVTGGLTGSEDRDDTYETTGEEPEDSATHTWTVGEVQFGPTTEQQTITYKITCKNLGTTAVDVKTTGTVFGNSNLTVSIKEGKGEEASLQPGTSLSADATQLDYEETYTLIIEVSIKDVSVPVNSDNTLSLTVTVE